MRRNRFVSPASLFIVILLLFCRNLSTAQLKPNTISQWRNTVLWNHPPAKSSGAAPMALSPKVFRPLTHTDTTAFSLYPAQLVGVICGDATWIDFDNDGDLDIVISGYDDTTAVTKIYRNDNGVFTELPADMPGIISCSAGMDWGDYDNDGDFDLLIIGRNALDSAVALPVSKIFRNDGGTFVDINAPIMPLMGNSAKWVDYNNDGLLDVLIGGATTYGHDFHTKLYRNTGSGFVEVPIYLPGVWGSSFSWGDYDNDGDPDLLLTGYGDWGVTTALFRNDCHSDTVNQFTQIPAPLQEMNSCGVAWGDYDNDGRPDIVMSGDPPTWTWNTFSTIYHNNGGDSFTDINPGLLPVTASAVAWGDYDNDGYPDLALSGWYDDSTSATLIYHNNHDGTFTDIGAAIPGTWFGSLAWGDVDNDGRLDLLISGGTATGPYNTGLPYYRPITQIWHNNLAPVNAIPAMAGAPSVAVNGNQVSFGWAKATDDRTPQKALSYNIRLGTSSGANDLFAPNSNVSSGFRRIVRHGNNGHATSRSMYLPNGTYYFAVQAIDNSYAGSHFSGEQTFVVGPAGPMPKWEMVSIPDQPADMHGSILFPGAHSRFWEFSHEYIAVEELRNGAGYWVKLMPDAAPRAMSGPPLAGLTIPVHEGWNMIGSIGTAVPAASVGALPEGQVLSQFFEYSSGAYHTAAAIQPGSGYWVKASAEGSISLGAEAAAGYQLAKVVPTTELPPAPPEVSERPVPAPRVYALNQNYPNPFNPSTTLRFEIGDSRFVHLRVYDVLGREVATLVNGLMSAGEHHVTWNASGLSSGIYICRIQAGSFTGSRTMVLMR